MTSMELQALINNLCQSSTYPHQSEQVEMRQTHISLVFLAGDYAYKLKKPLALGFLDYSTLEKRRHFCHEEVRLNRRLAPDLYLDVVPVVRDGDNLVVAESHDVVKENDQKIVDYMVKMKRLSEDTNFRSMLNSGQLEIDHLVALADKLVDFYQNAALGGEISVVGDWPVIAQNSQENFEQIEPFIGKTLSREVYQRLLDYSTKELQTIRPLVEKRARDNVPRDTHGDLRLEHVYWLYECDKDNPLRIIDCVEFNKRFRYADPVLDIAFLAMELEFEGHSHLSQIFTNTYLEKAEDNDGEKLMPFCIFYRHIVRAKIHSFKSEESSVSPENQDKARLKAMRHYLSALVRISKPMTKPCLVLLSGLPGVGKSTLAEMLCESAGFERISSDATRKKLANLPETADAKAAYSKGIYTPAMSDKTYGEMLSEAKVKLFQGRRVVVDASFVKERYRERFLNSAQALGVPGMMCICNASQETVRERLMNRPQGASDADWNIYLSASKNWEPQTPNIQEKITEISTEGSKWDVYDELLRLLELENIATR